MTSRDSDDRLRGYQLDANDEDDRPATGRRVLGGFAALAGIVLIILSVLAMTGVLGSGSGGDEDAASAGGGGASASASATTPTSDASPTETEAAPDPEAKAPLTVLNNSGVQGLAAQASDTFAAAGWEISQVGNLADADLTTTTVYYTDGSDEEKAAAEALQSAFPQIGAVEPRPETVPYSGVVVVLTSSFQP